MKRRMAGWLGSVSVVGTALLIAACGGHMSLGEDGAGGNGTSNSGGSGVISSAGTSNSGAPTGDNQTCLATCADAAGTVQSLSTFATFYAAIEGRWLTCGEPGAAFPAGPADVIGVEFAVPGPVEINGESIMQGKLYYLVQGASGPERGAGFDYQLTYDVSAFGDDEVPRQLNIHPTPNSGFGGAFKYSPCPEEFDLEDFEPSSNGHAVLVRVPQ